MNERNIGMDVSFGLYAKNAGETDGKSRVH
jgi:hypothetical protein